MDILHLIDRGLILLHVLFGTMALVVRPVAMLTAKGGPAHRSAGKIYFWGMAGIFFSTIGLAFFRFSPFLFVINIMSFYTCFVGYRVLYRKRPDQLGSRPIWLDWLGSGIALLGGLGFVGWGGAGLLGASLPGYLAHGVPTAFYVIGLVAGGLLTNNAVIDLRSYTHVPTDRNWWWFEHMSRFLGGYIATLTAFLVQNVSTRMPADMAWIVWVTPGVLGGFLVSRWVQHYRSKLSVRLAG